MGDKITIEFTIDEVKDLIIDYFGVDEEDFDIDKFNDEQIKQALLDNNYWLRIPYWKNKLINIDLIINKMYTCKYRKSI